MDTITISTLLDTKGFERGTQKLLGAIKSFGKQVTNQGQKPMKQVLGMAKQLIPTLVGVGSVYGVISKAVSTFMSQNIRLQKQMSAVWTSLGNLLGPIITEIIGWVTQAVSYFLSFLKLLGVTSKTASQLSKAANSAAGGLSATVAGFDELNKLQSGGIGAGRLEDKDPTEFMQTLADLLKNKLWDEVADLIIDKIDNLISIGKSKAGELGEKLSEYLYAAFHVVGRVINEVDWGGIGETLANFINGLFSDERISGEDLGAILVGKFTVAFKVATGFLETIDGGRIAEIVSGLVTGAIDALGKAIEEADFTKIGANIKEFIENIDWESIKESLAGLLSDAWHGALELIQGLLGGEDGEEVPLVSSLTSLGESIKELADAAGPALTDFWENCLQPFCNFLIDSGLPAAIQDIADLLSNLADLINGDIDFDEFANKLSDVDNILIGIGEIILAIKISKFVSHIWDLIDSAKKGTDAANELADAASAAASATSDAGGAAGSAGEAVSGASGKLKTLVKNMALGLVILVEAAAAAIIFVAAVWAIGELLQEVVEAWQPVIDNGETAATAIGLGAALLVLVGAAAAGLGAIGTALMAYMALGLVVLVEMGIATGLFLVEIWGIGELLQEVIEAWQPVLDNGETVEKAILYGTALLVAIGVAAATLGAATVASAGALPLAIALGTALLVELGEATKVFIRELSSVAECLADELAPELEDLNKVLPDLGDNMTDFTDYMEKFASEVVRYTESTGVIAMKNLGSSIRDFFLGDPIDNMVDEAQNVYDGIIPLNQKLELVNPELEYGVQLLTNYTGFIAELETLTTGEVTLGNGVFINMKDVGSNLVAGFVDGIESKASEFSAVATTLTDGFEKALTDGMTRAVEKYTQQCDEIAEATSEMSLSVKTDYSDIAKTVKSSMSEAAKNTKTAVTGMSSDSTTYLGAIWRNFSSTFSGLVNYSRVWGADLIQNFINGLGDRIGNLWTSMSNIAQGIRNYIGFSEPKMGPLSNFHTYAPDMIDLFTKGIEDNKDKTLNAVSDLAGGISEEIQDGDYSFGTIGAPEMGDFMDGFADKVVNGFADMVARMQDIADNVVFSMPVVAGGGFLPYNVSSSSSDSVGSDGSTQMVQAMQQLEETITRFENAVDSMEWVIKFGNVRAVVQEITKVQKQMERARGGA